MYCLALMPLALLAPALAAPAPDRPSYGPPRPYGPCPEGLARRADGACVEPVIRRNLYLYNAPAPRVTYIEPRYVPEPQVNVNYVFVRTSNALLRARPLVVGPSKQQTLVYLLNKQIEPVEREVIEVEHENQEPDVYFVNYSSGENPELPGGVSLETALSQSESQAEVIGGSASEEQEGGGQSYLPYQAPAATN